MNHAEQVALLEELAGLKMDGRAFLDATTATSPVETYTDPDRFARERAMLRTRAAVAAVSRDLPGPGSFLTRDLLGAPLLLTRDRAGEVHAFLNVCRHRGARLVDAKTGCKHAFACPYHAWTFSNTGELRGVPHGRQGFPELDKSAYGLARLHVAERGGLILVTLDPEHGSAAQSGLDAILADMTWLALDTHAVAARDSLVCKANWKILVEGGIEAYHFKVAHRDTIGPHFEDNLSSYQTYGEHMRSVLPRSTLSKLADMPTAQWSIRDQANVLYTLFPINQFLVMQDHVAWIEMHPRSPDETWLQVTTLAPLAEIEGHESHWARNQAITLTTLREDFEIGEGIQTGLRSGANATLSFGRFEGALARFNTTVTQAITGQPG